MNEGLAALLAATAWAGDAAATPAQGIQQHLKTDLLALPWYIWIWAAAIALIGWFASSAPTLAGWIDDGHEESARELWTRRWGIVGRLATCMAAGLAAFLAGILMGTPMVANFLAVLFAAYAGDKYLQSKAGQLAQRQTNGGAQGPP